MDGDRQLRLREGGTDVRSHVVRPFGGMAVEAGIFGNQALKEIAEIGGNVGVGILLDHQRG